MRCSSRQPCRARVAALQLVEEGKLDLDAPIEEYCPEFAKVQVLERLDGEKPVLRPPASKATVKNLITHTAGLGYWFWNADIAAWESATGTPNVLSGSKVVFNAPMVADPGTRFVYGINTDWLGQVIEAAGAEKLDEAIKTGVTDPLGMNETAFVSRATTSCAYARRTPPATRSQSTPPTPAIRAAPRSTRSSESPYT